LSSATFTLADRKLSALIIEIKVEITAYLNYKLSMTDPDIPDTTNKTQSYS